MIRVSWNQLKQIIDQQNLIFKWTKDDNSYSVSAIDAQYHVIAVIPFLTQDAIDFETNYKANGNQEIKAEVVTQFEKRDKTLKLVHLDGDVSEDGTVSVLLKVPGIPGSSDGRWISSGTAFFDSHTPGDKVLGVYFTDEDNILGNGSGTVVGSYTDDDADEDNRGWVIPPIGHIDAEAIGGYGFAPAGFYIKIIAKKAGDSPSGKFYCNIEWGKVE